mgnify:CR=1 FL=1
MTKINASITFLPDSGGEGCRIDIEDKDANVIIFRGELNAEQFCQMMGRLACTRFTEAKVGPLDKIGKIHQLERIAFKVPGITPYSPNRKDVAREEAKRVCPEGWEPDTYFGSQDSFFTRDGEVWAGTIIRRWVPREEAE